MTARPPTTATPAPTNVKSLAVSLLAVAAEVEVAEAAIKREIMRAAQAGDTDRVIHVLGRWLTEPPVKVAADLASHALLDVERRGNSSPTAPPRPRE